MAVIFPWTYYTPHGTTLPFPWPWWAYLVLILLILLAMSSCITCCFLLYASYQGRRQRRRLQAVQRITTTAIIADDDDDDEANVWQTQANIRNSDMSIELHTLPRTPEGARTAAARPPAVVSRLPELPAVVLDVPETNSHQESTWSGSTVKAWIRDVPRDAVADMADLETQLLRAQEYDAMCRARRRLAERRKIRIATKLPTREDYGVIIRKPVSWK